VAVKAHRLHSTAPAIRDAALAFRSESLLIIGHKHINALFVCALLKEPLTSFRTHIVEVTIPYLLAGDAVEALCFGTGPDDNSKSALL